jgi:hypothetical protein
LFSCPKDCVLPPGSNSSSGRSGLSFCPEKAQIEFAFAGAAVGFPVPVSSPATAAPVVAPVMATAQTSAASVDRPVGGESAAVR